MKWFVPQTGCILESDICLEMFLDSCTFSLKYEHFQDLCYKPYKTG